MKQSFRVCWFIGFLFLITKTAYFTVYNYTGNNTTRYVTTLNQAVETTAKGFVFFTNGVIFNGTVNVALPVPVNGNVQFGSRGLLGTCRLVLETDLTFGSTAGTSNNTIKVDTTTGSADIDGTGGTITFDSDTFFPNSRAFNIISNLTIDGGGHDMVFGKVLTFTVQSGVELIIRDAHVRNLQTLNFVGTGKVTFYNVTISLDNDWTYSGNASIGTPELRFDDYTRINGKNKKFIFAGSRDLTLVSDSAITFDPTVTFSWASQRRNGLVMDVVEGNIPYTGTVPGSVLYFNNSNFYVPSHGPFKGLNLKKGSLIFDNGCNIYNEANMDVTRSLQLGDASSSSNNTDVYIFAGAQVNVDGYVYDASV